MAGREPNHTCACCGKRYYACNYCDKTGYKWLACSPECFNKVAWKYGAKYAHLKPKEEEIEEIKKQSEIDLSDYADELKEIGFDGVMYIINKENETKLEV